jgi:pyruvate/2-oxoglutarate dehydrogenase complex dihydrolipoamide acyltransferase (E2) component
MPGMGKHSDLKNWQARTVVAVVAVVAVGLAVYSAAASYETVSHLAAKYGVPLSRWTPIGLDGGLFGAIIINIGLIWLKKPVWWFGMVARFFAIAVIAANGAAGWPRPIGIGLRVAAPVLFVIIMEAAQYVLLYRTDAAEAERQRKRDERIPFARWILAPFPTFVIWRRKKLWTDSHLPQSAIDAELSVIRLAELYGDEWQEKADADLVWMIQSGVNMDQVLERVRKLLTAAAEEPARQAAQRQAEADAAAARADAAEAADRAAALERKLADAESKLAGNGSGNGGGDRTRKPRKPKAATGSGEDAPAADIDIYAAALEILSKDPDISASELGRRLNRSEGRGRQIKRELTQAAPQGQDGGA